MKTWIRGGTLLTPYRELPGSGLLIEDGKILGLLAPGEAPPAGEMEIIEADGRYVAPGFIDVHVHGGGGYEVMGAPPEEIAALCRAHCRYGTTSLLPTTLASPVPALCAALDSIRKAQALCEKSGDVNILGAHLEGPFLAQGQRGAQAPEYIIEPDQASISALLDRWDGVRMMGAAPEIPGGLALGREITRRGITASIAHSDATFAEVEQAMEYGYSDVTHIYSGCSLTHRVGAYRVAGVVEAGLCSDALTAQVIADGKHLPPELLRFIVHCKGCARIVLITDGLGASATEAKEGEIYIQKNGVPAILEDGVMKLMDRLSFAGSIATMSRQVRNMHTLAGVPLCEAVRMGTANPAKLAGAADKGMLAPGYDADVILFDEQVNVTRTLVKGRTVYAQETGRQDGTGRPVR